MRPNYGLSFLRLILQCLVNINANKIMVTKLHKMYNQTIIQLYLFLYGNWRVVIIFRVGLCAEDILEYFLDCLDVKA